MKLADHVENIRRLIDASFRNRLGRMGITTRALQTAGDLQPGEHHDRDRIEAIREVFIGETGSASAAYEKLVEEFTFTLFNRLAALKVMEAHTLHPEILTRRSIHGDRSFAHKHWLELHPEGRRLEMEGMIPFMEDELAGLARDIPLFDPSHPYHLLPTAIELNDIITAFNNVETDPQVEPDIWKSDDVLGWLYESYNNYKEAAHKASGDKTEYNKVSIQSQVYTPRWVVQFMVDNSLAKLYLEMYPDSEIKRRYKIANTPKVRTREPKPLTEIKFIDPATGSGNFLFYAFDLFYDLYTDQIDNYGAGYDEREIAELIITHNLHGIDLDDRAIQIAQLGLYIKARRKKRTAKIDHFNVVSSDFFLPGYEEVKDLFESEEGLNPELKRIVKDLWADLQQAYKFGALIQLEEKFSRHLHGLVEHFGDNQPQLFEKEFLSDYEGFRSNFFANLQKAVAQNAARNGQTFLNIKTQDAISFLHLLTQKYDVAVANPPYTDSSDFGPELKKFIEANYRKPEKFNANLYAAFIKRCFQLTDESGFIALIHPHTFMYIQSFEDVRKYIIERSWIDILVDYGLDRVNLFGPGILLEAAWYVLSKKKRSGPGTYINITSNQQEKFKRSSLLQAYDAVLHSTGHERVYLLEQEKLKMIGGWPFIYWISDGFRKKFIINPITEAGYPTLGLKTANNNKFLRFWWEVSQAYPPDKWVLYAKGGEYNKWYGNIWLVINWQNNGEAVKKQKNSQMIEKGWDFKEGVTLSTRSVKGSSARLLDKKWLFDMAASSIISIDPGDTKLLLSFANTMLFNYILDSLNPTVNIQPEDIRRVPFVKPLQLVSDNISTLSDQNVNIKKELSSFSLIELNYAKSPLLLSRHTLLKERLMSYLNFENARITLILLNEAIADRIIFDVYELSAEDRQQVLEKMGVPIGDLPVQKAARDAYLSGMSFENEITKKHIDNLSLIDLDDEQVQQIRTELNTLYQKNNDIEAFCKRHRVNPINVWYWFKESKVLPEARAAEIALEFLSDALRSILMEDEDGIIPLVGLPGEPKLMDRLEQYCVGQGFTSAQFVQLGNLLERPVDEYIEHHFFRQFSDHLNLFMYLPKTPFIWHLSSGEHQGFEAYVIIYKWKKDSLYKLKSGYLSKRVESLQYRLLQIKDSTSAQALTEKETIRLQLQEIEAFTEKIDQLIAENYDPKLDDGVARNLAPLQKKGMLKVEVLNKKQLQNYLEADW